MESIDFCKGLVGERRSGDCPGTAFGAAVLDLPVASFSTSYERIPRSNQSHRALLGDGGQSGSSMIDPSRTVALVGRPNVSKSRLFNRLCGRRLSIVHDMLGVTRDLISAEVRDDFVLLDTGGIGMELGNDAKAGDRFSGGGSGGVRHTSGVAGALCGGMRSGMTSLDEMVAEKPVATGSQCYL